MSAAVELVEEHPPKRRRLPTDRKGVSHSFVLGGMEVHFHTGEFDDGTIGELFIDLPRSGSTMSGILDAFATAVSLALQHGVSLEVLAEKYTKTNFEPNGIVAGGGRASSILDYIFEFLRAKYARRSP